jgi:hypothetical protein
MRDVDLKKICKNCGLTRGSHSATEYYSSHYKMIVFKDYCPGHEGRMDWDEGPGTVFEESEDFITFVNRGTKVGWNKGEKI